MYSVLMEEGQDRRFQVEERTLRIHRSRDSKDRTLPEVLFIKDRLKIGTKGFVIDRSQKKNRQTQKKQFYISTDRKSADEKED